MCVNLKTPVRCTGTRLPVPKREDEHELPVKPCPRARSWRCSTWSCSSRRRRRSCRPADRRSGPSWAPAATTAPATAPPTAASTSCTASTRSVARLAAPWPPLARPCRLLRAASGALSFADAIMRRVTCDGVCRKAPSTAGAFVPVDPCQALHACLQDTSLSVWRRQRGELTYTSLCYHKLTPPPSRLSNNAAINVLSAAACLWRPTAESQHSRGASRPRIRAKTWCCSCFARVIIHPFRQSLAPTPEVFLHIDTRHHERGQEALTPAELGPTTLLYV